MDDTTPQPSMGLPILAGIVAAVASVGAWALLYLAIHNSAYWLAPPISGVLIGLAVRIAGHTNNRTLQVIAAVLTFLTSVLGYAIVYATLAQFVDPTYTPTFGDGIHDFFRYLDILLLTAIGCYLAYAIAHRRNAPGAPE